MNEEYLEHFPQHIGEDIEKYATDVVFKRSRYIFTRREGSKQYGYCTHCHEEFKTKGLTHNDVAQCPNCKSDCTVKSSGRGRKYMEDCAYFTYYEKSVKDPNAIIAKSFYATRNYSGDYKNVSTRFYEEAYYLFQPGNSMMFKPVYYRRDHFEMWPKVRSLFGEWGNKSYIRWLVYSRESIKAAVQDTPFQYSTWENYCHRDMVEFFDLFCKYPCIEQLTKVDCKDIVESKLSGGNTYSAVNWRGKTIFKVLRINKKDLRDIRASKVDISPLFLRLYQVSSKDKSKLSIPEIRNIENSYGIYFRELQGIHKYAPLKKIDSYINKQFNNQTSKKNYYSMTNVLTDWKDYIGDCIKLGMDLTKENILYPKNLHSAHQNTIKQVKLKADEELNKKIKQRSITLNKQYSYKYKNLFIRAAESSNELIAEGKALSHCVGTYVDRYAKGETNILVIRKENQEDIPYYTMEIRNNEIVQVRGNRNCSPTEEVEQFIKAFKISKLKENKTKIKIPA